jgi:hypothetical protein
VSYGFGGLQASGANSSLIARSAFPTRRLVEPVLYKDRPASISAIEERLKNKKKWEQEGIAPYADLLAFKKAIVAP